MSAWAVWENTAAKSPQQRHASVPVLVGCNTLPSHTTIAPSSRRRGAIAALGPEIANALEERGSGEPRPESHSQTGTRVAGKRRGATTQQHGASPARRTRRGCSGRRSRWGARDARREPACGRWRRAQQVSKGRAATTTLMTSGAFGGAIAVKRAAWWLGLAEQAAPAAPGAAAGGSDLWPPQVSTSRCYRRTSPSGWPTAPERPGL